VAQFGPYVAPPVMSHIVFGINIKERTWREKYTIFEIDYPWTIDMRK
jgi:hypothetical protein